MKEEKNYEKKYLTSKYERVFYTIMVDQKDYTLMEKVLETILGGKVEILGYLRTQLKVKNTLEKVKISDVLITLDGELIHLEIETGTDLPTKVKKISNFFNVYSELL